MKSIIRVIGSAVFTLAMYAIPIVLTCSFVYEWDGIIRLFLVIFSSAQLVFLFVFVLMEAQKDDDA